MSTNLSRRGFMGAAGIAGLTVAGLSTLSACGSGATVSKGGSKASAKLKLPTYAAVQTAPADLAGNAAGLDATYLRYPKALTKSVAKAPGDGSRITALTETFTTPAPPQEKNAYWQELNKRLGARFDMTIVVDQGVDAYLQKFNAMMAERRHTRPGLVPAEPGHPASARTAGRQVPRPHPVPLGRRGEGLPEPGEPADHRLEDRRGERQDPRRHRGLRIDGPGLRRQPGLLEAGRRRRVQQRGGLPRQGQGAPGRQAQQVRPGAGVREPHRHVRPVVRRAQWLAP